MKTVVLTLAIFLLLPFQAFCENEETLDKIEGLMSKRDFKGALAELKSSPIKNDRSLYITIRDEINAISDYSDKCFSFFSLMSTPGEQNNAIANYEPLLRAYDFIPDKLHFSEKFAGHIDEARKSAEAYVQKQCGKDYGQIKVGMRLDRVQKCVGEFYLHGQVKSKIGVVEHYTRGGTYLYVKSGKVVAWGE